MTLKPLKKTTTDAAKLAEKAKKKKKRKRWSIITYSYSNIEFLQNNIIRIFPNKNVSLSNFRENAKPKNKKEIKAKFDKAEQGTEFKLRQVTFFSLNFPFFEEEKHFDR